MLNKHKIEFRWKVFIENTAPELREDSVQYKEMKRAFYAGCFDTIIESQQIGERYIEKEACAILNANLKELEEFFKPKDEIRNN